MVSVLSHVKDTLMKPSHHICPDTLLLHVTMLLWKMETSFAFIFSIESFIWFCFLDALDSFVEETGIRSFFGSLQTGSIPQVQTGFVIMFIFSKTYGLFEKKKKKKINKDTVCTSEDYEHKILTHVVKIFQMFTIFLVTLLF